MLAQWTRKECKVNQLALTLQSIQTLIPDSESSLDRLIEPLADSRDTGTLIINKARQHEAVQVVGMDKANIGEVVRFYDSYDDMKVAQPDASLGVVLELSRPTLVGLYKAKDEKGLKTEKVAKRTGQLIKTPVGPQLKGRVINALGQPLDGKGPIESTTTRPIFELPRYGIMDYNKRKERLHTGFLLIDCLQPVFKGQTVLINGGVGSGKSTMATEMISSLGADKTHCVFVCIGKSQNGIRSLVQFLEAKGAMSHSTVVVGDASDFPALQTMAIYTAAQIGIDARERGEDAIVFVDEMNTHVNVQLTLHNRAIPSISTVNYELSKIFESGGILKDYEGSLTFFPIMEGTVEQYEGNVYQRFAMFMSDLADQTITLSRGNTDANMWQPPLLWTQDSIKSYKSNPPKMMELVSELQRRLRETEQAEEYLELIREIDSDEEAEELQNIVQQGRRIREVIRQRRGTRWSLEEQLFVLYFALRTDLMKKTMRQVQEERNQSMEEMKRGERKGLQPTLTAIAHRTISDTFALRGLSTSTSAAIAQLGEPVIHTVNIDKCTIDWLEHRANTRPTTRGGRRFDPCIEQHLLTTNQPVPVSTEHQLDIAIFGSSDAFKVLSLSVVRRDATGPLPLRERSRNFTKEKRRTALLVNLPMSRSGTFIFNAPGQTMNTFKFFCLLAFVAIVSCAAPPPAPSSFRVLYSSAQMFTNSLMYHTLIRDGKKGIEQDTDLNNFSSMFTNISSSNQTRRDATGKCDEWKSNTPLQLAPLYTVKNGAKPENKTCSAYGKSVDVDCYDGTFLHQGQWASVCFNRDPKPVFSCVTVGYGFPGIPDVISILSLSTKRPVAGEFLHGHC
ncbi:ATP synthase F1 [Planoprotostelium fungivorum]|uniref:ATP synthase F1 n=1 Tax=Planoprotostelium fungivorum TaxID=1890364 RepID=A0A2P6NSY4_9EUKA|nr:ATP synthase F1 [Planoprotostelium fungivorum]